MLRTCSLHNGGSDDTLVGPLGRCVGASDHVLFVCFVAAF